ncbi:MAG: protein kinase [Gimesia sp.]
MSDSEETNSSENPNQDPGLTRENINPQSIEGLFLIALEKKTPAERTQFLDEMCGDNLEQRRRVEALLMAYEDAGSFLEKSPVGSHEPQPLSLDFLTPSDNPDLLGTLGEYEIKEIIGQGGMGIVFRALDPKLNRIVAIKVMSPLLAVNPNARKRFLREAQAAAAVSHPHIVTIHAVNEAQLPYLVMEYVVGQSLQEKLDKEGSLQVTEILRIGSQIADGLDAAHKQGLIHRDIKPANILLENGVERVKITDFGLARAVDDVTITKTGEVSGTPQYMSPEQATGDRIDQRSDLFSLGAVLYAMCTGRSPFRASNLVAVVRRVCDDTPRPIEEVSEDIPNWLIEIIDCLLEKQPEDRVQSAAEVAELLGKHLAMVQQPAYDPRVSRPSKDNTRKQVKAISGHPRGPWGDRFAVWAGGLLLLVPLFLWGIGSAGGGHFATSVEEMVLISLLICGPIGLLVMIYGAQNIVQLHSISANVLDVLFLLGCLLLGPLGILLYITHYKKKRDTRSDREEKQRILESIDVRITEEQRRSNKRVLIGVGVGIGLLLMIWGLSYGWGVFRKSQISIYDWLFVSAIVCVIVGGLFVCIKVFKSESFRSTINSPWKMIGWMILCVPLFFVCLFILFLLAPMFARESNDVVLINYNSKLPITKISTETGQQYDVRSQPFRLKLPPGQHILHIKFRAPHEIINFTKNINKEDGKQLIVNLRPEMDRLIQVSAKQKKQLMERIAEQKKRAGLIVINKEETGLKVEIRPVGLAGKNPRYLISKIDRSGSWIYEVVDGEYKIEVISDLVGWDKFNNSPRYLNSKVVVQTKKVINLTIACDFKKLADSAPDWNKPSRYMPFSPSSDFFHGTFDLIESDRSTTFRFRWPSKQKGVAVFYPLSIPKAKVVQQLFKAFANEKPDVSEHDLLATVNKGVKTDKEKSLTELFNKGKHPAWKTLIVPGKAKNTWRLIEPKMSRSKMSNKISKEFMETAKILEDTLFEGSKSREETVTRKTNRGGILLSGQTRDLRAGIFLVDPLQAKPEDGVFGFADRFYVFEPMTFEVPAGFYKVKVTSANAGWVVDYSNPQYTYATIEVKPGKILSVEISRDYKRLAENHPNWSPYALCEFVWPVSSKITKSNRFKLSIQDAKVVQQLLEAFANGKPDVSEHDLLAAVNKGVKSDKKKSLTELFNKGKHPAWGTLIVPGIAEKTFRLVEPKVATEKSGR